MGNPAKIIGYVDTKETTLGSENHGKPLPEEVSATSVNGVTLHSLKEVTDIRGRLSAGEFERSVPFKPLRYFLVYDVPTAETRGEHAHLNCHQFLVAVKGSCT